jgi:hypothetical protein
MYLIKRGFFRKDCFINYDKVAFNQTVRICRQVLTFLIWNNGFKKTNATNGVGKRGGNRKRDILLGAVEDTCIDSIFQRNVKYSF